MARVNGSSYTNGSSSSFWRDQAWFEYTVSTNNATTYALTLASGGTLSARSNSYSKDYTNYLSVTGKTTKSATKNLSATSRSSTIVTDEKTFIASHTQTWSKTHSTQSVTVSTYIRSGYKATQTFTIPQKYHYTVSYNANGGSSAPAAQTKWYDETLTLSTSKPSRSGYAFYRWSTATGDSGSKYSPGGSYTANSAATLYAVWNPYIYYNANGGGEAPATQTKTYNIPLTLSSTIPTRANYEFNGWNTNASGTGTNYSSGGSYTSNNTATLYAKWISLPLAPTISSMTALRWDEVNNIQDDTGTSAKVTIEWSVDTSSQKYGSNNSGTVSLTATSQTGGSSPTITPVSGTTGTSGTAVFMLSGLDGGRYDVKATVEDVLSSTEKSNIITATYFVMDMKAGGKEIAFGASANDTLTQRQELVGLFKCDMEARFNGPVTFNDTISGDTEFTGSTTFDKSITVQTGAPPYYEAISSQIDLTASPPSSGDIHDQVIRLHDTNGTRIGQVEVYRTSADVLGTAIQVARTVNGELVHNTIAMRMDANGNMSYTVGNASAFRSAIGLATTSFTVSAYSTTTGTFVSGWGRRYGNIVQISISVRNTSSVASGSNVYVGTLSGTVPAPILSTTGASYYGSHSIIGFLQANRSLTVRNASSTAVSITGTNSATLSFTYITE